MNGLAESLFATLFPADCRLCASPLVKISRLPVCEECLAAIRPIAGGLCSTCGERLFAPNAFSSGDGAPTCALCRRLSPPFEKAVAYGSYEGGLRDLIHLLKYERVLPASNVLGRMLAEAVSTLDLPLQTAIVPVPLHAHKLRERGFNQSELICRATVKHLPKKFEMMSRTLVRRRETQSQIGLSSHERRVNMRGAFTVARPQEITGREVLLVDDVFTTGTTVSECARILRRAGASKVWVATVARTLKVVAAFAESEERESALTMAAAG